METKYKTRTADTPLNFSQLYQAYSPELFRYGISLYRDREFIGDVVQELFLNLWERRELLQSIENVRAYLFKAFRRRLIKRVQRKRTQDQRIQEMALEEELPLWSQEVSAEEYMLKEEREKESSQCIDTFLETLTPRRREVVLLRYYDGLNHQEIADHLGLKYQTVLNHFQGAFNRN